MPGSEVRRTRTSDCAGLKARPENFAEVKATREGSKDQGLMLQRLSLVLQFVRLIVELLK